MADMITGFASSGARLEDVLARIHARMSRQDEEIALLREELARRPTADDVRAVRAEATAGLRALEHRVARLETAISLPEDVGGIARVVMDTRQRVERAEAAIATRAEAAHVESIATELRETAAAAARRLDDDKAAKVTVQTMELSLVAARRRIDGLEANIARKADLSHISELEATAAILREERSERDRLSAGVDECRARIGIAERAIQAEVVRGEHVTTLLEGFSDAVRVRATNGDVEAVRADVVSLRDALVAHKSVAEDWHRLASAAVAAEQAAREDEVTRLTTGIADAHRAALSALDALRDRPIRDEVAPAATVKSLEEAVEALRTALRTRALASAAEATAERVHALARETADLGERLRVALDFVEWYASRGEAYEHNAAALDRHMRQLAAGNVAVAAAHHALRHPPARAVAPA